MLFRAIPEGYKQISLDSPSGEPVRFGFDETYVSSLGYASSTDGVHFTRRAEPFLSPDTVSDRFGVEDPRITRIDGTYFVTYTGLSKPAYSEIPGWHIGLASTEDFVGVKKYGSIGPQVASKDTAIFPRRIGGKIWMLHRIVPDIQAIVFEDLDQLMNPSAELWQDHVNTLSDHVVMGPEAEWEAKKIGTGPTPIETDEGWLLIYHGVDQDHVYRAGLALLDLDDPRRVISRTSQPIMEPQEEYELIGDVNNVVFPQGAAVIGDTLHIYYGGADRVIGHATASMDQVLHHMRPVQQHV